MGKIHNVFIKQHQRGRWRYYWYLSWHKRWTLAPSGVTRAILGDFILRLHYQSLSLQDAYQLKSDLPPKSWTG